MASTAEFPVVFQRLRSILASHAPRLLVKTDTADVYYLDTHHVMPQNKLPLFFGSAQIKKSYVSFYLFPIYMYPEMLEGLSPGLRKRMQGKSCFNFTQVDESLFEELAELTAAGMARFEAAGYVSK